MGAEGLCRVRRASGLASAGTRMEEMVEGGIVIEIGPHLQEALTAIAVCIFFSILAWAMMK